MDYHETFESIRSLCWYWRYGRWSKLLIYGSKYSSIPRLHHPDLSMSDVETTFSWLVTIVKVPSVWLRTHRWVTAFYTKYCGPGLSERVRYLMDQNVSTGYGWRGLDQGGMGENGHVPHTGTMDVSGRTWSSRGFDNREVRSRFRSPITRLPVLVLLFLSPSPILSFPFIL